MEQHKCPSTRTELERVREAFEQWRRTRRQGMRIPEPLWDLAVELTEAYSLTQICQTLRVEYNHLKRRAENRKESTSTGGAARFIQLEISEPVSGCECVIELERRDGSRMRMSLKGAHGVNLVELARLFSGEA